MAAMKKAGLVLVLLLSWPLAGRGQGVVVDDDDDDDFIPQLKQSSQGPIGKKSPGEGRPAKEAGNEAKANPRLQKLNALSYDRRPSAILKAWSSLEKEAKLAQETKEKEKRYPVVSAAPWDCMVHPLGAGLCLDWELLFKVK